MRRVIIVFIFAACVGFAATLAAQQPSLQEALASTVRQLSACQTQNGALLLMQADILSGKYVSWETVKSQLEVANPTVELDVATKKLAPKEKK